MRRALAVARKTLRQRGRGNLVFLVLVQPLLFCLVWGFCVSLELRDAPIAIFAPGADAGGRPVERALERTGIFRVTARVAGIAELERALASGAASLGVIVTRRGTLVIADGSDATVATQGLADAAAAIRAAPASGGVPVRVWYNAGLRSSHLLLLGALCYNLVWLLSYPAATLMDERERGGLLVLGRSPLRAAELWLGTALPYVVLGLWGSLSQLALAVAVAGLPLRGNPLLLAGGLALFALIHVNLGFVVAAVARTGAQRTLGQLVLVFLMLSVSGFLIPELQLPAWLRAVAEGVPLHHGLRLVRGLLLRGAGAADLAHELAILAAMAAGTSGAAIACARLLLRGGRD